VRPPDGRWRALRSSRTGARYGSGQPLKDKTNLARAGLNPAHDPRSGKNSSTLGALCNATVRKADIEESTSAVDAGSLALQSSYPGGNFSVAAAPAPRGRSGSRAALSGRAVAIDTARQESIRPCAPRAVSVGAALSFGRLGYAFQGLPPQRNSPSAVLGAPVPAQRRTRTRQRRVGTAPEVSHGRHRPPSYAACATPRFAQTAVKHERVFLPPSGANARSRCCGFAGPHARTVPNSFNRSCRSTINRRGISLP